MMDSMQETRPTPPTAATLAAALTAAALGAALLGAAPPALAKQDSCKLKIRDLSRIEPASTYDPYGGTAGPEFHRFEIQHQNGPGCAFAIGVDDGENGGRRMSGDGGDMLYYELWQDSSRSQRLTDPVTGDMAGAIVGFAENGNGNDRVEVSFYSTIQGGQGVSGGTYRDRVGFRLYLLEDGMPSDVLDTQDVQVRTRVANVVSAAVLVGGVRRPLAGTAGVLDFGQMSTGATRSFDLEVSGNSGYDVTVQSENQGQLVSAGRTQSIGYSLTINGRSVSLGSPVVISGGGGYGLHQMVVTIGDVSQALAGDYADSLVVTVAAR